jgi:acetylornithine/succinyldiaminopimelate/putrescine aminotransferase
LDRVFLVNSGAEAVENALRIAFAITGRKKAVALKNGLHGRSAAASAVTDHASWYAFPHKPFDVQFVTPNRIGELEEALDSDTACFIFEPVQGMAGAVALDEPYLRAARELCTRQGVLMIADEVQTGMGRTGSYFGVQSANVVPDLMTVAKGIAGGFPAAALLAPSALADGLKKGSLGTTFGGGPVACAAIVATIDTVGRSDFLTNVARMSQRIQDEAKVGPVTAIQGKGLLLGLRTRRTAKDVLSELQTRGILAGGAHDPNIVRLLPPLIIDDKAVDGLVAALRDIRP